jgi:hypothetical protein
LQSESKRRTEFGSYRFANLADSCKGPARALNHTVVATSQTLHESLTQLLDRLRSQLTFEYLGISILAPARNALAFTLQAGDYSFPPEIQILDDSLRLVVDQHTAVELLALDHHQFSCLAELLKSSPYRCLRVVPLLTANIAWAPCLSPAKYECHFQKMMRTDWTRAASGYR